MRLEALKHMAGVAMSITRSGRIVVFGSSSLFGTIPDADNEYELIRRSLDADFILDPFDEGVGRVALNALGVTSPFEQQFGYHADIIRPVAFENFPPGWDARLIPLADCPGVFCLEPHDMAVAKLFAGRPKDIALLSELVRTGRLDPAILYQRLTDMPLAEAWIVKTHQRLREVAEKGGNPLPK
jgi:hypothetical protein